MSLLGELVALVPLDVLPPTPLPGGPEVYPRQGQGFAASIVGAFMGLGTLIVAMMLLSLKPRRAEPDERDRPRT